ncbi:MAG: hypothetical protein K2O01_05005 [Bacteroidales bacterium]|nr:hypothetical protein [Bacteroidales bacterium]
MENKEQNVGDSDLEQMKSELASLKYVLSERLQVENRLIRQSMTGRQRDINRRVTVVMALGIVAMWTIPWSFGRMFEVSVAFMVMTELMMLGATVLTALWQLEFRRGNFATADLVQAAEVVARFRRRYVNWPKIGLPLAAFWLIWMLWEIYQADNTMMFVMGGGCLIGGLIGGVCGWRINRSVVSDADDVLAQIAELQH